MQLLLFFGQYKDLATLEVPIFDIPSYWPQKTIITVWYIHVITNTQSNPAVDTL